MTRQLFQLPVVLYLLFALSLATETTERRLKTSELTPVGQRIGYAVEPPPNNTDRANFYVVFPAANSQAEKLLSVNERTGEIRLQANLDHEQESELTILVIPTDGSPSQKIIIEVEDANDNTPTFGSPSVQLEISEQARIDTELPLPLAIDPDSEPLNVQKYRIAGGNVNNVFRLAVRRLNGQLYADLVVNGNLDREYRARYDLLIEAIDGGSPPKIGRLEVRCQILDANDNAPEFEHSRYSVQLPVNTTLGQPVIRVAARDADDGENARLTYTLTHANYEPTYYYQIDSETGQITVAIAPLPAGTTHDLLVTARDNGAQPLETSVFLSVHIQNEEVEGQSIDGLQITWLTDNGQPILMENLTIGYLVARLELGEEYSNGPKLSVSGCDALCLKETDTPTIYLLMVCGALDRELHAFYRLQFTLTDQNGHQVFQHPVHIEVGDLNDWAPEWSQPLYRFLFNRTFDHETSTKAVGKLMAHDRDAGENARLRYTLHGTNLFEINSETGVLNAIQPLNCSAGSETRFRVLAEDHGHPRLSTMVDVQVDLIDSEAPPPLFDKPLYEIQIREDAEIGECLVQIHARNFGCGGKEGERVRYSLQVGEHDDQEHLERVFRLDPQSGRICLGGHVDFERRSRYQLTVIGSNIAGKKSSALLDIHVQDVNDHAPQFEPHIYYLTLREGEKYTEALLNLKATDEDRGENGQLHYFIEETTNDVAKFRLDQDASTGHLYLETPLKGLKNQSINEIQLKINARDGGGMTSSVPATVHVYLVAANSPPCIQFQEWPFEFQTTEDILPGIIVGTLRTQSETKEKQLEIVSGDPDSHFRLDSKTGRLLITKELDADHRSVYWLSVKATIKTSNGECSNHTQVRVLIQDINDNEPRFDMAHVEASIPEDQPIHEPFFAVQAIDKDRNENGKVTYELVSSTPPCPVIVRPQSGQLLLAAPLDFEQVQQYKLRIRAQDQGVPPRSSTINVTLNVFDVNDHAPEFSSLLYTTEIPEDASLMSGVIRVSARDQDSGANSRLRYHIGDSNVLQDFGINALSGEIFVRRPLDRERQADYRFLIVATDQGNPPLTSNASVLIQIGDINDNSPNCSTIRPFFLNEQQNLHRQLIGRLDAEDKDAGANGTVTYRLQKFNELFDLKPNGDLFLRRKIPQMKDSYRLAVIAEDQAERPRSVVCQILIKVEKSPSEIVIQEPVDRLIRFDSSCGVGCPLVRLNATNVKRWSLDEKENTSRFFDLSDDGLLKLKMDLDKNGEDELFRTFQSLTIHLFDAYEQQKQLTLNLKRVPRLMDNSSMVVHVSERAAPGQRITGPPSGFKQTKRNESTVFWALSEESDVFEVEPLSGALYLRSRLNYSNNPIYMLRLAKYTTKGTPLNETTVMIDVQNENMAGPHFESSLVKLQVSEATPIGSILAQIEAIDRDEGKNGSLTYKIIGESPFFGIDSTTGEISLLKTLQHHLQPEHYFILEATDQPSDPNERRRSSCVVLIQVEDTNDNAPAFLSSSSMTLLADLLPTNQPVHYFVAKDMDSGEFGRVQYTIVNGNKPPAFVLDQQTGALTVLHRPTQPLVQLTVRASDSDPTMPRFTEQLFSIQIQANEAKWTYFEQPVYDFTLAASTVVGTPLVDFRRPSFESSVQPNFKLLPQTITDFELDSKQGILKTTTDQLQYGTYHLTVHASDPEQKLSDLTTVLIHVPDHRQVGPKITVTTCGEVWVKEGEATSKVTRIVATIENKESAELSYQIEGEFLNSGSGVEFFTINSTTGIISSKELDRENIAEHILVVSASDQSVPRKVDVCTVRVKVLDINDNSPQFTAQSPQQVAITNDHQTGMVVAKFEATDKDEGPNRRVVYRLGGDESGAFDINVESGELFLARDTPVFGNSWEIVVVAEDMGLSKVLHAERRVQIAWKKSATKMSKLRELEFLHQNQSIVVAEGQPKGKFVVQIETTAKFMDAPHKVEFQILDGNHGNAFQIDELGVLKTNKELDAEAQLSYSLKIQATMPGGRKTLGHVNVRILNINDNAPMFPHVLSRRIEEDTPVGSLIISISARDSDIDGQVEYALAAPSTYFELQRSTGDLILLRELDFEQQMEHVLSVQAFDGEYSTFSELRIHLIDINDNAPTFTSDLYEFTCLPSLRLPADVGQVAAVDGDSGEIGSVSYKLVDNGDAASLKINEQSGLVTLLHPLHEHEERFITIQAIDHGTPPLSSISTIKLSAVPKMAKEAPQFAQQNFSFMVAEDFPLHLAFGKLAIKNMSGQAIPCRFQIEDTEMAQNFEIDSMGQISLRQPLDFETHQVYKTRVSARNLYSSTNVQTHVALLEIQVVDVNDNKPEFTKQTQSLVVRIDESVQRGNQLAILKVEDSDSGENGHVSFSLLPAGDTPLLAAFSLDSAGVLRFERWHDDLLADLLHTTNLNDSIVRRTLIVKAEDAGVPSSQWSLLKLKVELDVRTWSGTAPFFPLPSYRYFVTEGANNGSRLLRARATNRIGKEMKDEWTYKLINNDEIFKINSTTAEIFLNGQLDYEKYRDYEFTVSVTDKKHRSAVAPVYITVVGVDEFAPVFTRTSYTFQVPWSARPGQQIGRVQATDQDAGVDGRIVYTLAASTNATRLQSSLIGVDPQSGILLLRSVVNASVLNGSDSIELNLVASTSPTQFARATVLVEFDDKAEPFVDPSKQEASVSRLTKIFLAGLVLLLVIIFLFLVVFCARFCATRRRRQPKPRKQIYSVARGNIAVMTNMDRHSPTYARKSISRFSSPTTIAATSLLSSSAMSSSSSDGEKKQVDGRVIRVPASRSSDGVRLREDQTNTAMSRSHGDSGIDADGISIGSLNDYLNQISARTAFSASKSASTFADPVNAELLNATASDTYRTAVSQSSSGIYDFPMRPTIKPIQMKRNMNNSYVSTMRTFSDPQETNNQQDYLLLHGHAQP